MPVPSPLRILPVTLLLCACASGGGVRRLLGGGESRELTREQQARQAVNRLTFGPRPGEVDAVAREDVDAWIDRQLHPEMIPDTAVERALARYDIEHRGVEYLVAETPRPDYFRRRLLQQEQQAARGGAPAPGGAASPGGAEPPSPGDTALARIRAGVLNATDSALLAQDQQRWDRYRDELLSARVARAVVGERELQEVMTDFWENHFSVYLYKLPTEYALLQYDRDVIRPRALGRFRDLLGAVARSPAMLYYLDNWESQADSGRPRTVGKPSRSRRGLNENYGRELLELHTLGVDGGYTQQDVIAAARALTGWTIQGAPEAGGGFVFRPEWHDAGPKTFLGHALPAGRGIEDGEAVLDLVARHPSTARFIATKLVRRFVSDSAPAALVARAAATFTRTDGDIREVLRTILLSPEFFSRASYHAKVKTPFEVVVSAVRVLGGDADSTRRTAGVVGALGQPLFQRLTPDGWPDAGDAWINTGAILARINFGMTLIGSRLPGVSLERWPPAATLLQASPAVQADGVIAAVLEGEASPDTRGILVSGQNPLAPAGSAAAAGRAPAMRPRDALLLMLGLAVGAPEFQRR